MRTKNERPVISHKLFQLILNRDTGYVFKLPVGCPTDKVPDGSHILPFTDSEQKINRLIEKYNRKPYLLEKYAIL